jgi:negative regulator of sigma E activity
MNDIRFHDAASGIDLRQLPVFKPDSALWPRMVAAQQRRTRVQRWRRGSFSLAAAAAVCAAVVLLPHPLPPLQQEIAAGQRESQTLESQWLQLANSTRPGATGLARVRVIDDALQAAYDRGAQADELAPLWRQRNQALRGLIAHVQDTDPNDALAVTRI